MLLFELRISQGNGSIDSKEKTNDRWHRRNFICSNTVVEYGILKISCFVFFFFYHLSSVAVVVLEAHFYVA